MFLFLWWFFLLFFSFYSKPNYFYIFIFAPAGYCVSKTGERIKVSTDYVRFVAAAGWYDISQSPRANKAVLSCFPVTAKKEIDTSLTSDLVVFMYYSGGIWYFI